MRSAGRCVWKSLLGRRSVATVYSLVGCPPLVDAVYLLVRRLDGGRRQIIAVRRTRSTVASLNLAHIRRTGARLGADEVHVIDGKACRQAYLDLVRLKEATRGNGRRRSSGAA